MLPASGWAQAPIQPVSYGPPGGGWASPPPMVAGPGYGPPCPPGSYGCGPGQDTIYELLPDDRCSFRDGEFCDFLGSALQHTYFRVEYLNWSMDDPGRQIVGAQRPFDDERELFNAVDPVSQTIVGLARVTTYDPVGFHRNNGVRGVLGIPTRIGTFEAGVSVLEQSDAFLHEEQFFSFTDLNQVIPAITLLRDGVPNENTMILFRDNTEDPSNPGRGMNVALRTEFFATEANFILPPTTPNQPLSVRPLFGFQYIRFWDNVDIFGTDTDVGDPDDPDDNVVLNHKIVSDAENNVFAPQVGLRFEFNHEWFSLGATPKFMLGFNRHRDEVFTREIFLPDEPRMSTHEEDSEFAPGLDLSVYGKVHIGRHLSLFVSYQLYYLDNISRATDNIHWDTIGGTTSNIVLKPHQEGIFIDGVTVGGEFRFH